MSTQFVKVCEKCVERIVHYHRAPVGNIVASRHYGGADKGVIITVYYGEGVNDETMIMPDVFDTVGINEVLNIRELKVEQGQGKRSIDTEVERIEAILQRRGRCTECGGGEFYWKHIGSGDPLAGYHLFQQPKPPEGR